MIPSCSLMGKTGDEDAINDYFVENFKGDCLLAGATRHRQDSLTHQ